MQERRKEAERLAREREELRRQQEQLRYEQEKRNNLKRGRDVDQRCVNVFLLSAFWRGTSIFKGFLLGMCRREDPYWNGGKKMHTEPEGRMSQGSDYNNRQQNRFNDFNPRDRTRYPPTSTVQSNNFDRLVSEFLFLSDLIIAILHQAILQWRMHVSLMKTFDESVCRRNRFDNEADSKKNRPAPRREGSGFERYPKNFEPVRRAEPPPPPRTELRDSDRREIRDRDERRQVAMPDRSAGGRAPPPAMAHSRPPRDGNHSWKSDGGMNSKQGDVRWG